MEETIMDRRTIPSRYLRWLKRELPVLTDAGVLDAATAERVRDYYDRQTTDKGGVGWAVTLFSIIGSLLIGGGIILLFAHNWDQLSRPTRTLLSLLPLAIGSAFSMAAVWRKAKTGVREAAGLFHALTIGSAIALIGQTYHIPGNVPAFMLTWALLALPLMFLLRSVCAFLVYLALVTSWTGIAQNTYGQAVAYWALLLPPLIFMFRSLRPNRHAPAALLTIYGVLFSVTISLGVVFERTLPGLWTLAYASLLSGVYLLGTDYYRDTEGWGNPLKLFGVIGIATLAYLFTYTSFWDDIGWRYCRHDFRYQQWGAWMDTGITFLLITGWALAGVRAYRRLSGMGVVLAAFPVLAAAGFLLAAMMDDAEVVNALLFNSYFFALGLLGIVSGCRRLRLRELNGGMFLLSLLIVTRFFDSEFGFLARGIAFIVLGAAFLVANLVIARRKKKEVTA